MTESQLPQGNVAGDVTSATEELFDRAQEYDAMLHRGLKLSGEDKTFFQRGRLEDLARQLPPNFTPRKILDFGCGLGDTTQLFAELFPAAQVVGCDTAEVALEHARERCASERLRFLTVSALKADGSYDLAYVNGVFHHIPPAQRPSACRLILDSLAPGGRFAFFENNPWNPGTRWVMSRIDFDRDAQTLSPPQARRLLAANGFEITAPTRFLFLFPRFLSALRWLEPKLVHRPLGAQYWILGRRL